MPKRLEPIWAAVKAAAGKWELDPALVGAVVLAESGGEPGAVRYEGHVHRSGKYIQDAVGLKPAGCSGDTEKALQSCSWGLMQVMGFNARAAGYKGWLTGLCRVEDGLEQGCLHLAGLLKKWPDPAESVSAYNQGSPVRDKSGGFKNQAYVDKVLGLREETRAWSAGKEKKEEKVEVMDVLKERQKPGLRAMDEVVLAGCDRKLRRLFSEAGGRFDIQVLQAEGRSASVVPGKDDGTPDFDLENLATTAYGILETANRLGIKASWGGQMDPPPFLEEWRNLAHWELEVPSGRNKSLFKSKTFWTGASAVVAAAAGAATGQMSPEAAVQTALGGLAAIFLRDGLRDGR